MNAARKARGRSCVVLVTPESTAKSTSTNVSLGRARTGASARTCPTRHTSVLVLLGSKERIVKLTPTSATPRRVRTVPLAPSLHRRLPRLDTTRMHALASPATKATSVNSISTSAHRIHAIPPELLSVCKTLTVTRAHASVGGKATIAPSTLTSVALTLATTEQAAQSHRRQLAETYPVAVPTEAMCARATLGSRARTAQQTLTSVPTSRSRTLCQLASVTTAPLASSLAQTRQLCRMAGCRSLRTTSVATAWLDSPERSPMITGQCFARKMSTSASRARARTAACARRQLRAWPHQLCTSARATTDSLASTVKWMTLSVRPARARTEPNASS